MKNINIEKIKEILNNGKKGLLNKVAPFVLATAVVASAVPESVVAAYENVDTKSVVAYNTYGSNNLSGAYLDAYVGINLYVDNKLFTPTDVTGKVVKPFLYNGTTYLPARAISNVYNLNISWNDSEKAVYLEDTISYESDYYYYDTNGNKVFITNDEIWNDSVIHEVMTSKGLTATKGAKIYHNKKQFNPKDATGKIVDVFIIDGTTYLPVRAISNLLGVEINYKKMENGGINVYMSKPLIPEIDNKFDEQTKDFIHNELYKDTEYEIDPNYKQYPNTPKEPGTYYYDPITNEIVPVLDENINYTRTK